MPRLWNLSLVALASISLAACGGGGGGGGGGGSTASQTTFTGNLAATTALQEPSRDPTGLRTLVASLAKLAAAAHAQAADVQVCVEGTSFCTVVADDGTFTLAADVGGTVTLVFTAPDFTARVTLTGIPLGATVRLRNLHCSTVTGTCAPDDFEIEGGAETRNAIDCEQGPMHVVQAGELVIQGDGDDCIHTAGQCEVTIEADHLVLRGCASCVDAAGGSAVTLTVGTGGFECHAQADGINAVGNSSVHVNVAGAGDIDVEAGQVGLLSSGTASIAIAGDQCHVDGAMNAVRTNGNASIDTTGCTTVDLVGGTSHDDGDDDEGNDRGNGKNDGDEDD
jgi:hypothetical protein